MLICLFVASTQRSEPFCASGVILNFRQSNEENCEMRLGRAAALLYTAGSVGVIAFQIALAGGAPWGAYAMGGVSPGQFPLPLRIAALAQAALVGGTTAVVMSRAGLITAVRATTSRWLIWLVVAFAAVSLALNLITPSAGERAIWAPVIMLQLASSAMVAIKGSVGRLA